jgi:hypothetical protein
MSIGRFAAGPVAGLLLLLGVLPAAHAAPAVQAGGATYCSVAGSPNGDGMRLDDVTFSGNLPTSAADDCFGIVGGNDSQTGVNSLGLSWGTDWHFLVKDGGALGTFEGIGYALNVSGVGATGGSWTLTAGPAVALPVYVDFVAALKGSNEFALWYFDDVRIGGSDDGSWSSVFTNRNGRLQGLSHMSLYVRQGTTPPAEPPETPPPGTVPEPSALGLVTLALAAAYAARRRRRT